jgi:cytochrome c biogenesis protein
MTVVIRYARLAWRWLTAMRTALLLLFLLALAAVPGSVLPQRPLNPDKTDAYIKSHGAWGRFLDRIGAFDVFGSAWFTAIYVLLFVSLVGCLVPRIRVHARALRRAPLPAPRNLSRLPESGSFSTSDSPTAYADAARATLGRRWRVVRREEAGGVITLSAEKGYSRETGNLLFHIALLCALVLIAVGRLYSYQGTRIVEQGHGFCNTILQYDSWKPGRFAAEGKVHPAPFCLDVSKFTATYTSDGEPSQFRADVSYRRTLDSSAQQAAITVNHPLRLEGDRVYLIGHGFSPHITVHMPDGSVVDDIADFAPTNATTYYSEGVFKEPGREGAKQDVGIEGFFAPTPVQTANGYASSSPVANNPVLGIFVYLGDLNINGLPQSVYTLDTSKMKKIGAANLRVGETKKFPNGVSVTFDGWTPWVSLQVSHDPAQGYLLIAAVAMVVGLLGSLAVRRRRVWLRIGPEPVTARSGAPAGEHADASPTVVQVGGLARSDSGNFSTEFAALLDRLRSAAATDPEPEAVDAVGAGKE